MPLFDGSLKFRYTSRMAQGKSLDHVKTGEITHRDWAVLLAEKPQILGFLPSNDFWYGDIQAMKHFLGKRFFFLTCLQVLPFSMVLGALSYFTPISSGVAGGLGFLLGLGILERATRKKLKKKMIAEGSLPGKAIKASAP